ncbi:hypothetical protein PROFUN_10671 [Planoprotostelium fungivorum]|uniref:Uncharacterized protein n=1 Tax=Planoprotostelium fungivorum TaxID=1890364 RepID=A0A2P6MUX9_9EUKA|nr:hypothetical protein PROFUN_10671 [Planoprotostelium fungivorum]
MSCGGESISLVTMTMPTLRGLAFNADDKKRKLESSTALQSAKPVKVKKLDQPIKRRRDHSNNFLDVTFYHKKEPCSVGSKILGKIEKILGTDEELTTKGVSISSIQKNQFFIAIWLLDCQQLLNSKEDDNQDLYDRLAEKMKKVILTMRDYSQLFQECTLSRQSQTGRVSIKKEEVKFGMSKDSILLEEETPTPTEDGMVKLSLRFRDDDGKTLTCNESERTSLSQLKERLGLKDITHHGEEMKDDAITLLDLKTKMLLGRVADATQEDVTIELEVRRAKSIEKVEQLPGKTIEVTTKTSSRKIYHEQSETAKKLLEKIEERMSLDEFEDVDWLITVSQKTKDGLKRVQTARFRSLMEQTSQRLREMGLEHEGRVIMYCKKGQSKFDFDTFMDRVEKNKKKLFILVADESHWGINSTGANHAYVNDPRILKAENVIVLLITATPWNMYTTGSRLKKENVVKWVKDKKSTADIRLKWYLKTEHGDRFFRTDEAFEKLENVSRGCGVEVSILLAMDYAMSLLAYRIFRDTENKSSAAEKILDQAIMAFDQCEMRKALVVYAKCYDITLNEGNTKQHKDLQKLALAHILNAKKNIRSETDKIVEELIQKASTMKIVRIPNSINAEVFLTRLQLIRHICGYEKIFEIVGDFGTTHIAHDLSNSYFLQLIKQKTNSVSCYEDLRSIPVLLILVDKGRLGDTFPDSFNCLDLRACKRKAFGPITSIVQELGRMCRYDAAESERLPHCLLSSAFHKKIRENFDGKITSLSTSLDPFIEGGDKQFEYVPTKTHCDYDNKEKHNNRFLLQAHPQIGKTGAYLELLNLIKRRYSYTAPDFNIIWKDSRAKENDPQWKYGPHHRSPSEIKIFSYNQLAYGRHTMSRLEKRAKLLLSMIDRGCWSPSEWRWKLVTEEGPFCETAESLLDEMQRNVFSGDTVSELKKLNTLKERIECINGSVEWKRMINWEGRQWYNLTPELKYCGRQFWNNDLDPSQTVVVSCAPHKRGQGKLEQYLIQFRSDYLMATIPTSLLPFFVIGEHDHIKFARYEEDASKILIHKWDEASSKPCLKILVHRKDVNEKPVECSLTDLASAYEEIVEREPKTFADGWEPSPLGYTPHREFKDHPNTRDGFHGPTREYGVIGSFTDPLLWRYNNKPFGMNHSVGSAVLLNIRALKEKGIEYPVKQLQEDVEFNHMCQEKGLHVLMDYRYLHWKVNLSQKHPLPKPDVSVHDSMMKMSQKGTTKLRFIGMEEEPRIDSVIESIREILFGRGVITGDIASMYCERVSDEEERLQSFKRMVSEEALSQLVATSVGSEGSMSLLVTSDVKIIRGDEMYVTIIPVRKRKPVTLWRNDFAWFSEMYVSAARGREDETGNTEYECSWLLLARLVKEKKVSGPDRRKIHIYLDKHIVYSQMDQPSLQHPTTVDGLENPPRSSPEGGKKRKNSSPAPNSQKKRERKPEPSPREANKDNGTKYTFFCKKEEQLWPVAARIFAEIEKILAQDEELRAKNILIANLQKNQVVIAFWLLDSRQLLDSDTREDDSQDFYACLAEKMKKAILTLSHYSHLLQDCALTRKFEQRLTINKTDIQFTPSQDSILLEEESTPSEDGIVKLSLRFTDDGKRLTCNESEQTTIIQLKERLGLKDIKYREEELNDTTSLQQLKEKILHGRVISPTQEDITIKLNVTRAKSIEKVEQLPGKTIEVTTKTSSRKIYHEQSETAKKLLEKIEERMSLDEFEDVDWLITVSQKTKDGLKRVQTARFRSLMEQTSQRLREMGLEHERRVIMYCKKGQSKADFDLFIDKVEKNEKRLFIFVVDECHWGINSKGANDTYVNDPRILKAKNVVVLLITATPWNMYTTGSRLKEENVVKWVRDKKSTADISEKTCHPQLCFSPARTEYRGLKWYLKTEHGDRFFRQDRLFEEVTSHSTKSNTNAEVAILLAMDYAMSLLAYRIFRDAENKDLTVEMVLNEVMTAFDHCEMKKALVVYAKCYNITLSDGNTKQHKDQQRMAIVNILNMKRDSVSETDKIVEELIQKASTMKIVRIPNSINAEVFLTRLQLIRHICKYDEIFEIVGDFGATRIDHDQSKSHFLKQIKEKRSISSYGADIPVLLILVDKGRLGDTFPDSFNCLDLRACKRKTFGPVASIVQELGRMCRYDAAESERLPHCLLSSAFHKKIRENFDGKITSLSTSLDPFIEGGDKQFEYVPKKDHCDYDNKEKHNNRFLLQAHPQIGKTGAYLELLNLIKRRYSYTAPNFDAIWKACEGEVQDNPQWKYGPYHQSLMEIRPFSYNQLGWGKYTMPGLEKRATLLLSMIDRDCWSPSEWRWKLVTEEGPFCETAESLLDEMQRNVFSGDTVSELKKLNTLKERIECINGSVEWKRMINWEGRQWYNLTPELRYCDRQFWSNDLDPSQTVVVSCAPHKRGQGKLEQYLIRFGSDYLMATIPASLCPYFTLSERDVTKFALYNSTYQLSGPHSNNSLRYPVFISSHREDPSKILVHKWDGTKPCLKILVVRKEKFEDYVQVWGDHCVIIALPDRIPTHQGTSNHITRCGYARRFIQLLAEEWNLPFCHMWDDNILKCYHRRDVNEKPVECSLTDLASAYEEIVEREPNTFHGDWTPSSMHGYEPHKGHSGHVNSRDAFHGPTCEYAVVGSFRNPRFWRSNNKPFGLSHSVYSAVLLNIRELKKKGIEYPVKQLQEDVEFNHMCQEKGLHVLMDYRYLHWKVNLSQKHPLPKPDVSVHDSMMKMSQKGTTKLRFIGMEEEPRIDSVIESIREILFGRGVITGDIASMYCERVSDEEERLQSFKRMVSEEALSQLVATSAGSKSTMRLEVTSDVKIVRCETTYVAIIPVQKGKPFTLYSDQSVWFSEMYVSTAKGGEDQPKNAEYQCSWLLLVRVR